MNETPETAVRKTHACDVCSRNPGKVYASGLGPVSYAMCRTCIAEGAEALGVICLTLFFHGGPDQVVSNKDGDWWRDSVRTYLDGQYVGWSEILAVYPEFESSFKTDQDLAAMAPGNIVG